MQLTHQAGEFDRLGERELVRIVPMRMNIPLLHTHAHISHSILHLMIIHSMMHTLTHSHNVQSIKLSTLSLLVLFFHLLFFLYSHAQSDGLASEIDRDHEAVQRTRQAPRTFRDDAADVHGNDEGVSFHVLLLFYFGEST